MSKPLTKLEKRLRVSGILIILGLVIEIITLRWSHPTAFLFFLVFGGMLMAVGILLYLYSLVTDNQSIAVSDDQSAKSASSAATD